MYAFRVSTVTLLIHFEWDDILRWMDLVLGLLLCLHSGGKLRIIQFFKHRHKHQPVKSPDYHMSDFKIVTFLNVRPTYH